MSSTGFLLISAVKTGRGAVADSSNVMFGFMDAGYRMVLRLMVATAVDTDDDMRFLSTTFDIVAEAMAAGAGAEEGHRDVGFGSGTLTKEEGGLFYNGFEQ